MKKHLLSAFGYKGSASFSPAPAAKGSTTALGIELVEVGRSKTGEPVYAGIEKAVPVAERVEAPVVHVIPPGRRMVDRPVVVYSSHAPMRWQGRPGR